MIKWQYHICEVFGGDWQAVLKVLDNAGQLGWELVSIEGEENHWYCVFKRPDQSEQEAKKQLEALRRESERAIAATEYAARAAGQSVG